TTPVNLDPEVANLKDSMERRALVKVLTHGLDRPVGYALPLRWEPLEERWRSAEWDFRREQMYLIPGDSAMGMRLPLDSLPWVAPEKREPFMEQSQFTDLPPLADYHAAAETDGNPEANSEDNTDETSLALEEVPHTAICFEVRDSRLYLFMPPLPALEQYLE
ncbi:MAG: transglutaminase family protein, partial [Desulfopila sp.]